MLLGYPPGPVHLSPGNEPPPSTKEPLSPQSLSSGQQFAYPRADKSFPLNSPSDQSHLPTGGGQSSLPMASGKGSLTNK